MLRRIVRSFVFLGLILALGTPLGMPHLGTQVSPVSAEVSSCDVYLSVRAIGANPPFITVHPQFSCPSGETLEYAVAIEHRVSGVYVPEGRLSTFEDSGREEWSRNVACVKGDKYRFTAEVVDGLGNVKRGIPKTAIC